MPPVSWGRLVRFVAVEDGEVHLGEPVDPDIDVGAALASSQLVSATKLSGDSPLDPNLTFGPNPTNLTIRTLLPPLPATTVSTIRCIGLNYRSHAAEMNFALPTYPSVFFKPSTCLNSPNAPLLIPYQATDQQADYEAELAVVIGRECRNASREDAMQYVLGYMCSNDVTARKWQVAGGTTQWGYGKGFDGFGPMGPCLVSTRKVPDPECLELRTELNGKVMQEGRVDDMIFSIPEIVAFLSQGTTLPAGTVIMTGTPHGIGASRNPPVFLQDGDDVRIVMSHGLGSLVNRVVYEKRP